MKYLLSALFFALLLISCGSDGTDASSSNSDQINTSIPAVTPATTPLPGEANPAAAPAQPQTVNIPAGPDGVVHHYICAKSDGGNGTGAGPCPVCGEPMAHNSAFHANQQAGDTPPVTIQNADGSTTSPTSISTTPPGATNPGAIPPTPPAAEPPQNSKGVWHYTCSNGCAGGGGSATACAGCGATLVHNPVYHQ